MVRTDSRSSIAASTWAAMLILLFAAGCVEKGEPADLKALGERLCLEQRFDEAIPVLKRHLIEHPGDAGAHFYLGRAYLFCSKPWLMVAQGEIETALAYFTAQGKKSSIPRFSDTYFEQICYIESAKVHLQQIRVLANLGVSADEIEPYVDKVAELTDEARTIDPTLPDIALYDSEVARMREVLKQAKRAAPSPPAEPPKKRLPVPKPREGSGTHFVI